MLGSATAAQNVAAQKPSLLVRSVNNLCLNSVAAYTAPALSPKHAFVAQAPPGGGEAVVGVLMMAYKGPINLFSYYRSESAIKSLIKW